MSLSTLTWTLLFLVFTLLSLRRASWGVAVYMLTYFALPDIWWWGRTSFLTGQRWSLIGGFVLLVAVVLQHMRQPGRQNRVIRTAGWLAVLVLANAAFVHWFLAPNTFISAQDFWLTAKFVLLFFLIVASIREEKDLFILLMALTLGAAYIGYEATINERGTLDTGRLEGIGTPSASNANGLACLMVTIVPLTGSLLFIGKRRHKLAALLAAPFVLNLILICNSRGAFLSLFAAAGVLVVVSRGWHRGRALYAVGLAAVLGWMLLGDPRIVERFLTTFVDAEQRDGSAAARLEFWKAGLAMVSDHPLGTGGDGFQLVYGPRYLAQVGHYYDYRSVHNGYIDDMCEWGLQGFTLRVLWFVTALAAVRATIRRNRMMEDSKLTFLGFCLISSMAGLAVASIFGDYFSAEWGYWLLAICLGYVRIVDEKELSEDALRDAAEPARESFREEGSLVGAGA